MKAVNEFVNRPKNEVKTMKSKAKLKYMWVEGGQYNI